jgi:metal-responsive CopG/Arc/MetJ family transcriptional regulator
MKTAISLPDDEFEAAERFAQQRGMSRSALFRTAVAEYLRREHADPQTNAINQHLRKHPMPRDEALEAAQLKAMRNIEWSD